MTGDRTLTDADLDAIARRVAEVMEARRPSPAPQLLTASEVARLYGVTPAWVRERASELGALRLGDGPRAPLRFDPKAVTECWTAGGTGGRSDKSPDGIESPARPRRSGRRSPSAGTPRLDLVPVIGFDTPETHKVTPRRGNARGRDAGEVSSRRVPKPTAGSGTPARSTGSKESK